MSGPQWDQSELAERARVSRATLAKFENGVGVPTANNLDAIRRAFEGEGFAFEVTADTERYEMARGEKRTSPAD